MLFCWPFSFGLSRRRVPQINPKRRQNNISAQVWKECFSWIFSEKCMFWTWFLQCVGLHDKKERKKGRILVQTVIELCSNHVGKYKLHNSKAMQVPLIFLIFSYFSFCLQEVLTFMKRMANGKALPASFFWCAQTIQLSTSFARPHHLEWKPPSSEQTQACRCSAQCCWVTKCTQKVILIQIIHYIVHFSYTNEVTLFADIYVLC